MKTKNLIIGTGIVLQMSLTLISLIAQESNANAYTSEKEKQFMKFAKFAPEFVNNKDDKNSDKIVNKSEPVKLQNWMLNPAEWAESDTKSWEKESMDPEVKLADWMLDPIAMVTPDVTLSDESEDSEIKLQDWMLDPNKMTENKETYSVENDHLEDWMLDPTKW